MMEHKKKIIKKRHGFGLLLVCLLASLPFLLLEYVGRHSVLNEIRHHVIGVATAAAAGVDTDAFGEVGGEESLDTPAYLKVQKFLDMIGLGDPDVRYIYTMRRSRDPLAPAWMMEYVVDQPARDADKNGQIDPDEMSERPGAPYDAGDLPALLTGFYKPSADREITPDPPYPDLISGYAPIKNAAGVVLGIVGVDVTAQTVTQKMAFLRTVMVIVWILVSILMICIYMLYVRQRDSYERISALSHELELRNEMLRTANNELGQMNQRFKEDLALAQIVQQGFLPTRFPRHDRIVFDQYYLTCEVLGGDLYDAFEIDQDHVGLYIADVAGHGVSAALISGLLKMTVSAMRQQAPDGTAAMFVDLTKPDHFLHSINALLVKEIPEGEFITMIYCVFNLLENKLIMASAGHPHPILYHKKDSTASWCKTKNGMALGIEEDQNYVCTEHPIDSGDVVLFYTDGLTEAMNGNQEEFGEERLISLVNLNDVNNASQLNDVIRQAVERHRDGQEVSDDFTLLTVEIR